MYKENKPNLLAQDVGVTPGNFNALVSVTAQASGLSLPIFRRVRSFRPTGMLTYNLNSMVNMAMM